MRKHQDHAALGPGEYGDAVAARQDDSGLDHIGVTDPRNDAVTITVTGVTQDEPTSVGVGNSGASACRPEDLLSRVTGSRLRGADDVAHAAQQYVRSRA